MIRLNLIAGCLLSLGMHAGVFWLVPAPALRPASLPETPIDTELLTVEVPLPPVSQPPLTPSLVAEAAPPPQGVAYDATKIAPLDRQRIDEAIEQMRASMSAPLPTLTPQLPPQGIAQPGAEQFVPALPELATTTPAFLEQALPPPDPITGVDKHVEWGQVRLGEKQSPGRLDLPQLEQKLVARTLPTPPPVALAPPPLLQFGIQGPVAKREPLYRPPLPKVQVQAESDITLKFWVRPDGVVSRVLPERKGDAALEVAAMRYLEAWRFTPLLPHEPQVEQWGTITVRFLLRER